MSLRQAAYPYLPQDVPIGHAEKRSGYLVKVKGRWFPAAYFDYVRNTATTAALHIVEHVNYQEPAVLLQTLNNGVLYLGFSKGETFANPTQVKTVQEGAFRQRLMFMPRVPPFHGTMSEQELDKWLLDRLIAPTRLYARDENQILNNPALQGTKALENIQRMRGKGLGVRGGCIASGQRGPAGTVFIAMPSDSRALPWDINICFTKNRRCDINSIKHAIRMAIARPDYIMFNNITPAETSIW